MSHHSQWGYSEREGLSEPDRWRAAGVGEGKGTSGQEKNVFSKDTLLATSRR